MGGLLRILAGMHLGYMTHHDHDLSQVSGAGVQYSRFALTSLASCKET